MSDLELPDEGVSALLQRASGPATPDELAGADAAVSRFVDVVLLGTPASAPVSQPVSTPTVDVEPAQTQPARRLRSVPISARAAAVIAAATIWSTGMAAAATGHLPGPVQRAVANTAAHVGLGLPKPDDDVTVRADDDKQDDEDDDGTASSSSSSSSTTTSSTTSPPTTTATTTASTAAGGAALAPTTSTDEEHDRGLGPDVNGPAHDGLCNAYLQGLANGHPKDPAVPPWRNLLDEATKAGKSLEQFCGVTTSTTAAAATTAATSTSTSTTVEDEGDDHGGGNGPGGGNGANEGPQGNPAGGPGTNNGNGDNGGNQGHGGSGAADASDGS